MAAPFERRLQPGEDVAPATLEELTRVKRYVRERSEHFAARLPRVAGEGYRDFDQRIINAILMEELCPLWLLRFNKDRPGALAVIASSRFDAQKFAIQEERLRMIEAGQATWEKSYTDVFMRTDDEADKVILAMQQEALREDRLGRANRRATDRPSVNLE